MSTIINNKHTVNNYYTISNNGNNTSVSNGDVIVIDSHDDKDKQRFAIDSTIQAFSKAPKGEKSSYVASRMGERYNEDWNVIIGNDIDCVIHTEQGEYMKFTVHGIMVRIIPAYLD